MSTDNSMDAESPDPEPRKRPYRSPHLEIFGKVSALTQGTSGECMTDAPGGGCTVAGSMSGMLVSDRNAKENVLRIGDHPLGIGLYLFDYRPEYRSQWGERRQFGVMADEVEAVLPAAVGVHPDGYRMVDYSMLGITRYVR